MKVTINSRNERYDFDTDGSKPLPFRDLGNWIALPYKSISFNKFS